MKRTPLTRTAWLNRGLSRLKRFVGVTPRRATPRRKAHPATIRLLNLLVIASGLLIVGMMLGGVAPSRFGEGVWALTAVIQSLNLMRRGAA